MPKDYVFISFCLFLVAFSSDILARNLGVVERISGKNLSQNLGLNENTLNLGGWLAAGFNYNPLEPKDHSNGPVQFNNRANEFNLYQLGLFVEHPTDRSLHDWQVGGRFEFMFGTDTPNTQASGHWDSHLIGHDDLGFYDLAFPQAYLEILMPVGNGVSAKIGHFYSILGYESVPSPPNLFVSHSYSMKSSPFTMSGLLLSYPIDNHLTVQAGGVTGPDNFDQNAGAWSFVGGFNWENTGRTGGFVFSVLDGDADDSKPSHLTYYYSMLHFNLTPKFHFVFEHDFGKQENAIESQNAEWYSVVNYLTYDIDDKWSTAMRAEWFHDDDGTRFLTTPGSYYEVSFGINWKPSDWLIVRPEVRYDWADGNKPFDMNRLDNQLLFSMDSVITF